MIDLLGPVLSGILAAGAAAGLAQYAKDRARSHQWEREEIQLDMQVHLAEMEAKVARHVHLTAAVRTEVGRLTKELNALAPVHTGALRRSVGGPVRGNGLVRLEPGEKFVDAERRPVRVATETTGSPRHYVGRGDLDRLIADPAVDIHDVVREVERVCDREAGASAYYRDNPDLLYPNHPWMRFVATGEAAYLGWEASGCDNG